MLGSLIRKIIGKPTKKEIKENKASQKFYERTQAFFGFFGNIFTKIEEEFHIIKNKCENLRETNYDLGLAHLEKGNLKDAIFRFKFIKRFWPDFHENYYQLAYCLVLAEKYQEAKSNLRELFQKNPNYDQNAHELMVHINTILEQKNPNND